MSTRPTLGSRSGEPTPDLGTTHTQMLGDGHLGVPVAEVGGRDGLIAIRFQQACERRPWFGSHKSVLVEGAAEDAVGDPADIRIGRSEGAKERPSLKEGGY